MAPPAIALFSAYKRALVSTVKHCKHARTFWPNPNAFMYFLNCDGGALELFNQATKRSANEAVIFLCALTSGSRSW